MTRTCDLQVRNLTLYPTELWAPESSRKRGRIVAAPGGTRPSPPDETADSGGCDQRDDLPACNAPAVVDAREAVPVAAREGGRQRAVDEAEEQEVRDHRRRVAGDVDDRVRREVLAALRWLGL